MNRAARTVLAVCLTMVWLTSCTFAPQSAATPTLPPSETPPPTATLEPTATATPRPTETPVPSPTPDAAATQAAQSTQSVTRAMERQVGPILDKLKLALPPGKLIWTSSRDIRLSTNTYMGSDDQVLSEEPLSDFILYTQVDWNTASGLAGCGVFFRSEESVNGVAEYVLFLMRLENAPAWDIEYYKYDQWQETLTNGKLQFSPDINDKQDGTNAVLLWVEGDQMRTFINEEEMMQVTHKKLTEGRVGLRAWQESGDTQCTFHDGWLWKIK